MVLLLYAFKTIFAFSCSKRRNISPGLDGTGIIICSNTTHPFAALMIRTVSLLYAPGAACWHLEKEGLPWRLEGLQPRGFAHTVAGDHADGPDPWHPGGRLVLPVYPRPATTPVQWLPRKSTISTVSFLSGAVRQALPTVWPHGGPVSGDAARFLESPASHSGRSRCPS
jgi:hypothetical protein